MYTYQIGNYKHKTDKELNEQELKTLVTQLQSSNVLSEEAAEQEEYSRVENLNNAELINSSRRWLTKTTGEDWTKQGDGEVIEQYYETMRDIGMSDQVITKAAAMGWPIRTGCSVIEQVMDVVRTYYVNTTGGKSPKCFTERAI